MFAPRSMHVALRREALASYEQQMLGRKRGVETQVGGEAGRVSGWAGGRDLSLWGEFMTAMDRSVDGSWG